MALFVLGAILGVAVQVGQTRETKAAADTNKTEADRQHEAAATNGETARHNKEAAKAQAALANRLLQPLREVDRIFDQRRFDSSLLVEGRPLVAWPPASGRVKITDSATNEQAMEIVQASNVDPLIEPLSTEIRDAIDAAETMRLSPG